MLTLAHAGSESIYGINISESVDDYSYALAYNNAFFEFIPEKQCDKENPQALLAHQVTLSYIPKTLLLRPRL